MTIEVSNKYCWVLALLVVDIKSWDIQKFFIVYQTFALSQTVRLIVVTLTSLSCKIKIMTNLSDVQKQTIQKNRFCE
jgi:hypothetical protein